jgi:hypothetical protein
MVCDIPAGDGKIANLFYSVGLYIIYYLGAKCPHYSSVLPSCFFVAFALVSTMDLLTIDTKTKNVVFTGV